MSTHGYMVYDATTLTPDKAKKIIDAIKDVLPGGQSPMRGKAYAVEMSGMSPDEIVANAVEIVRYACEASRMYESDCGQITVFLDEDERPVRFEVHAGEITVKQKHIS